MPGDAHVFTTNSLLINLHYTHGPGSWTLQEKEVKSVKSNGPVHGPPLQARVAAANGTVLAACKLLALSENQTAGPANGDPGAHGMNRG